MSPDQATLESFVASMENVSDTIPGSRVLSSIAARVIAHNREISTPGYNERYIDGGPKWGEHQNYSDGGQHGQTHRPK